MRSVDWNFSGGYLAMTERGRGVLGDTSKLIVRRALALDRR